MDQMNEFYSSADVRYYQKAQWENNQWQNNLPTWHTTTVPSETPPWQYTTPAINNDNHSVGYYPAQIPPSPSYTNPSSTNSPLAAEFPQDARYPPQPVTPGQDEMRRLSFRSVSLQVPNSSLPQETVEEEEESDACSWEPKVAIPRPARPIHRRSASANELVSRNAKRAHTVVEKNYRERLNDKINDLAQYLFETAPDSRAKPSKSLVMSRAKERLKQLESRNVALETEVAALKQRVAILDHVVANSHSS